MVRRCKLDPSLKAPPVSKSDTEKDNSAFNLNLVPELAPLQHGFVRRVHQVRAAARGKAVQVEHIRLTLG